MLGMSLAAIRGNTSNKTTIRLTNTAEAAAAALAILSGISKGRTVEAYGSLLWLTIAGSRAALATPNTALPNKKLFYMLAAIQSASLALQGYEGLQNHDWFFTATVGTSLIIRGLEISAINAKQRGD